MKKASSLFQRTFEVEKAQYDLFGNPVPDNTDYLAKEMKDWYGQQCFWVIRKKAHGGRVRVQRIFHELKKLGDKDQTHLLQKLLNDK